MGAVCRWWTVCVCRQATLAALKGSILAAADRCETELLPQQLQGLKEACAKESLSARWAKFESQSQAQRVTRLQAREAEVHQQATLHDTQLVQQKTQFNEECFNNKVPGFQQESQ